MKETLNFFISTMLEVTIGENSSQTVGVTEAIDNFKRKKRKNQ